MTSTVTINVNLDGEAMGSQSLDMGGDAPMPPPASDDGSGVEGSSDATMPPALDDDMTLSGHDGDASVPPSLDDTDEDDADGDENRDENGDEAPVPPDA